MDFNITNNAITCKDADYRTSTHKKTRQERINHTHRNIDDTSNTPDNPAFKPSKRTRAMCLNELVTRAEIAAKRTNTPNAVIKADVRAKLFKTDTLHLVQQIKQKVDNITNLYNQGNSIVEGIYERTISYDPERDCEIMQEIDSEGVLLRESIFKDGVLTESVQYNDDGTTTELSLSDGELESYKENLAKSDIGEEMDKYCTFNSGKISMYFKDYKELDDGYSFSSKLAWFDKNGQMTAYYEAMEALPDGSSTIDLHLRYDEDERIKEYVTDIKNGLYYSAKYILEDGKWTEVPPPEDK